MRCKFVCLFAFYFWFRNSESFNCNATCVTNATYLVKSYTYTEGENERERERERENERDRKKRGRKRDMI